MLLVKVLLYLEFYASIILRGLDEGYLATVQIGTPPRKFSVLMDSGSADFWVGAEGCEVQNDLGCVSLSIAI